MPISEGHFTKLKARVHTLLTPRAPQSTCDILADRFSPPSQLLNVSLCPSFFVRERVLVGVAHVSRSGLMGRTKATPQADAFLALSGGVALRHRRSAACNWMKLQHRDTLSVTLFVVV